MYYTLYIHPHFIQYLYEIRTFKNQSLTDLRQVARGHTADGWQSQNLDPGLLTPAFAISNRVSLAFLWLVDDYCCEEDQRCRVRNAVLTPIVGRQITACFC